MLKFSIVIPTMNHLEDCLKPCLESIRKHTDLSQCEVIVVSNGSTDKTDEYVLSLGHPFKLLSFAEGLGYAKATNCGITESRGSYVVLLNNDIELLDQPAHQWLQMLEQPFIDDNSVGITAPIVTWNVAANNDIAIFFCAAIRRQVIDQIGLLDEVFGAGGYEDVDYCMLARRNGFKIVQVPASTIVDVQGNYHQFVGGFPIYHKGSVTVSEVPEYDEIIKRNAEVVARRYNSQYLLGNGWERHVFGKHDDIKNDLHRREIARYNFAAKNLKGKRVLEIGCSAGYAKRFLPHDLDYTGVDYDQTIINFAIENYGDGNFKYICSDIHALDWKALGHFDTIIAYEVLEHLYDGREVAQQLKDHCDCLLITTPYNEPPGTHGKWHVLHWLKETDFPGFDHWFIQEDGEIHSSPDHDYGFNLMIAKWERGKSYKPKHRVLCTISTKNRYDILPMSIQSVIMQTTPPTKLVIYDDGERKDLREHPIYKPLFKTLMSKGIEWEVIFGHQKGQHFNHEIANNSGFEFVWRIDDDEIAEPNVLETLLSHFTDQVGAVGGLVYEPMHPQPGGTGRIMDVYHAPNIQWSTEERGVVEVEHLYSSFVYRSGIVHYNLDLSPVAHREETLFTHAMFRAGYKLLVDTSVKTYHYRQSTGGIRDNDNRFFYEHDEKIFKGFMEEWGYKLINLDVGLGDHYAFRNILPALLKKYRHVIIGCCYPDVFRDMDGVTIIPVSASQYYSGDNVYKWMAQRGWSDSILKAYAKMYNLEEHETRNIPLCSEASDGDAQSEDLSFLGAVGASAASRRSFNYSGGGGGREAIGC